MSVPTYGNCLKKIDYFLKVSFSNIIFWQSDKKIQKSSDDIVQEPRESRLQLLYL